MPQFICLTYHYIRDHGGAYPGIHPVSKKEFSKQLKELKNRFDLIGAQETLQLLKHPNNVDEKSKFVSITFDDGLSDQIDAADVLSDFDISGIFFISAQPSLEQKALFVNRMHHLRAFNKPKKLQKNYCLNCYPKSITNIKFLKNSKIMQKKCIFMTMKTSLCLNILLILFYPLS